MKIGVITFWWCYENYGQILQCYALQKFLRQRGHEPFLIKFRSRVFFDRPGFGGIVRRAIFHPVRFFQSCWRRVTGEAQKEFRRAANVRERRKFSEFRNKYIVSTDKELVSYDDVLKSKELDADAYLVGSDVVWKNFPLTEDGRVMFLDFGRKSAVRAAYSASFGADSVTADFKCFVAPLLKKLDAIGVRERSGVRICGEMGRQDAEHVADPVLLLSRADYAGDFGLGSERRTDVYFYYLRSVVLPPLSAIRRTGALSGLDIKVTTVYSDMDVPPLLLSDPTIPEWVRKIASARFFVTNSFHGACMAIVMHTPFAVVLKHQGKDMDSRLVSLLDALGLSERIFLPAETNMDRICSNPINWADVDSRLNKIRLSSVNFFERLGA